MKERGREAVREVEMSTSNESSINHPAENEMSVSLHNSQNSGQKSLYNTSKRNKRNKKKKRRGGGEELMWEHTE